jgi:hypothetical protein
LHIEIAEHVIFVSIENWQADGIQKLLAGENEKIALPEYGAEANITKQKK